MHRAGLGQPAGPDRVRRRPAPQNSPTGLHLVERASAPGTTGAVRIGTRVGNSLLTVPKVPKLVEPPNLAAITAGGRRPARTLYAAASAASCNACRPACLPGRTPAHSIWAPSNPSRTNFSATSVGRRPGNTRTTVNPTRAATAVSRVVGLGRACGDKTWPGAGKLDNALRELSATQHADDSRGGNSPTLRNPLSSSVRTQHEKGSDRCIPTVEPFPVRLE